MFFLEEACSYILFLEGMILKYLLKVTYNTIVVFALEGM